MIQEKDRNDRGNDKDDSIPRPSESLGHRLSSATSGGIFEFCHEQSIENNSQEIKEADKDEPPSMYRFSDTLIAQLYGR